MDYLLRIIGKTVFIQLSRENPVGWDPIPPIQIKQTVIINLVNN